MGRNVTIEIEGRTDADVDDALTEVRRLVREGYLSGDGSNDSGSYSFTVLGDEEPVDDEEMR